MELSGRVLSWSFLAVLAACGGKRGGAVEPGPSLDPCTAGLHAPGITARAPSWDALALVVSTTADSLCQSSPCGPDEPVSFVGSAPDDGIAVKVDGGWVVVGDVWDSDFDAPTARVADLGGGLLWLHLYLEETGRDEVTLDDGTETTATVIVAQTYDDFVIDQAQGKALFRAHCAAGEDGAAREPSLARDGDRFTYVPCLGDGAKVTFTAEQASACPSYVEGAR